MAVIKSDSESVKLLAQLMRAEAEGEGDLGMLLVGNVGVNRVRSDCMDFKGIRSVRDMVFQSPGGFESTHFSYFYQHPREKDLRLARQAIEGQRYDPASYSLWFYRPDGACPSTWWNQPQAGQYKQHCFFAPTGDNCPGVYNTY